MAFHKMSPARIHSHGTANGHACGTDDGASHSTANSTARSSAYSATHDATRKKMCRTTTRTGMLLAVLLSIAVGLSGCGAAASTTAGQTFPDFSLLDLQGNTVTQDIFSEHDLTVVNIWGTFCPPCIREMPDLGKLHRTLEADYNATLVGIVVDVQDQETFALANQILSQSQAEHLNLLAGEDVYAFLSQYDYVPTTLFVDSEGRLVGDPVVGGFSHDEYLAQVKARLQ